MAYAHDDKTPKQRFLEVLSNFLIKNRLILLGILSVITVAIVVTGITTAIINNRVEKATELAEEVQETYDRWLSTEEDAKQELEDEVKVQIQNILDKYPRSYASEKAFLLSAELLFEKEKWKEAGDRFIAFQDKYVQSYLASHALIKAGVAYEQAQLPQEALDAYKIITAQYEKDTIDTPRAYMSIARLYEQLENKDQAKSSYNAILDQYPASSWTKLAKARIIYLDSSQ